eukprot:CAMPEP_0170634692 /NCGR_PEP_ID=MMETSP0224-20130122/36758_1 /TAXON_ID=285029 /ORGANISM="Togula jolla, Strain CCCM 725" /LENGTH=241 /DNA_ID=CAMNT_0010964011 /DNA_START=143 /DNA_END=868 /DNA_ORIENTATION=-
MSLLGGAVRHSCKPCGFHLCDRCHDVARAELLRSQITLTIYRAAQDGAEEDTWQVRIERGATVGTLREQISSLYAIPSELQLLRRDVDGELLEDAEPLDCDEGDILHLTVEAPFRSLGLGSLTGGPAGLLAGLNGLAEAVAAVHEAHEAQRQEFERVEYSLSFVAPSLAASGKDRRCLLSVMATARVAEVLEMVKLELDAENEARALEFAGQLLPLEASIHAAGLRSGDTVLLGKTTATAL